MTTKKRPEFVDAHVHITNSAALPQLEAAGIIAARDAGTRDGAGLAARGSGHAVRVVSAGWALHKEGGYGARFGTGLETKTEIKAEILRLKQAGADIIKVMASGIVSLKKPGTITPGGFDASEIRIIVEESGARGLAVMAHANGEAAIMAAAAAGVRSIEHGFFMTPAALGCLAKNGIYWVPTVGAFVRTTGASGVSAEARAFVEKLTAGHLQMIVHARNTGVPLAIGTDAVLPDPRYGQYYRDELEWFVRAGISRNEVESIACEGGSILLGLKKNQ